MSLSSLKEIKLDFSWIGNIFSQMFNSNYNNLFQEIENELELSNIPEGSWILDMRNNDNGDFIYHCAKKYPHINFVFITNQQYAGLYRENLVVFVDKDSYEEFIIKNNVGYRRIISNYIDDEIVLSKIDKSLYKDYGNNVKSFLLVFDDKQLKNDNSVFKGNNINLERKLNKYFPIVDFNNN